MVDRIKGGIETQHTKTNNNLQRFQGVERKSIFLSFVRYLFTANSLFAEDISTCTREAYISMRNKKKTAKGNCCNLSESYPIWDKRKHSVILNSLCVNATMSHWISAATIRNMFVAALHMWASFMLILNQNIQKVYTDTLRHSHTNFIATFSLLNWTSLMWNGWMNSWWYVVFRFFFLPYFNDKLRCSTLPYTKTMNFFDIFLLDLLFFDVFFLVLLLASCHRVSCLANEEPCFRWKKIAEKII